MITRDAIDSFTHRFLAYETGAEAILAAADAAPGDPLVNAYAAMLHMFAETRAAPGFALPYLSRAEAAGGSAGERAVVAAIGAWVRGDVDRAIAIGAQLAADDPSELAIAKATQYHQFNRGDAAGMLLVARHVVAANPELPYAHGMEAFALEQSHALADAEAAARRAIALRRREPWAHHALAHVMLAQGRTEEGRAFLDDVKETWTGLNSFMLTHNYWHLALVLIEQGDTAAALELYDRNVWGVWKEYSQDQINAVSLLARLELAGLDVGDRWADVADHLAPRIDDHVEPFLSMQYLYGLARAGRPEASAMLDAIRVHAGRQSRVAWVEICVPACDALLAHARGDWAMAATLDRLLPRMAEIGGSHAQRDLFTRISRDAEGRSARA